MRRALAAALLSASAAWAAPPDARIALLDKKPHFQRVEGEFSAVEVEPPELVHAELLPTQELLLEPRAAGVARVFLFTPRLVRVVEVAALVPLPQPDPGQAAPAGCAAQDGAARIASAACYEHWRARLLRTTAAEAPGLSFEGDGLHAELKAAQAELDKRGLKLQVAVTPFGVRLLGARDEAQQRRALIAIWPAMLGPLRIDR